MPRYLQYVLNIFHMLFNRSTITWNGVTETTSTDPKGMWLIPNNQFEFHFKVRLLILLISSWDQFFCNFQYISKISSDLARSSENSPDLHRTCHTQNLPYSELAIHRIHFRLGYLQAAMFRTLSFDLGEWSTTWQTFIMLGLTLWSKPWQKQHKG